MFPDFRDELDVARPRRITGRNNPADDFYTVIELAWSLQEMTRFTALNGKPKSTVAMCSRRRLRLAVKQSMDSQLSRARAMCRLMSARGHPRYEFAASLCLNGNVVSRCRTSPAICSCRKRSYGLSLY